jgi:agmatine deiminase
MLTRRDLLGQAALTASAMGIMGCDSASIAGQNKSKEGGMHHLPEEAGRHLRTFMQWPASKAVYTYKGELAVMQQSIALIASTIARFEPVVMLGEAEHKSKIMELTGGKAEHWDIPTDDLWCRDSGPLFVQGADGGPAIMNFNFNGWGNKQPHGNDSKIAKKMAARLGLPIIDSGLVGEPGGLEYDGDGTIIALESCWVNKNRNTHNRDEISRRMCAALGAKKVIWAPGVKGRDITDYHIDALARFVRPGVILIQLPEKIFAGDPYSKAAYETYEILKSARDARGKKFEIIVIEEPIDIRSKSEGFVASYVNYYLCNGAVIAGQFGDDRADEAARNMLSKLYPSREVIMLNVDPIGEAGGGIHCSTQQQPLFKTVNK